MDQIPISSHLRPPRQGICRQNCPLPQGKAHRSHLWPLSLPEFQLAPVIQHFHRMILQGLVSWFSKKNFITINMFKMEKVWCYECILNKISLFISVCFCRLWKDLTQFKTHFSKLLSWPFPIIDLIVDDNTLGYIHILCSNTFISNLLFGKSISGQ